MGRGGEAEQVEVGSSDVGQAGVGQIIPELDALGQPCAANRNWHRGLQQTRSSLTIS